MKNYRLHFIRHGLSESNLRGEYCGKRTDSPLCRQGMEELVRLREQYEYPPVEAIFSSPLLRCVQTAGILYPGQEILAHDGLLERDFGVFDGKSFEELEHREDFRQWAANANAAPPEGETPLDVLVRVERTLEDILRYMMNHDLRDAAVITHGVLVTAVLNSLAVPLLPPMERMVGNGRGYTFYASAALWSRDRKLEVAGIMPHGATDVGAYNPELLKNIMKLNNDGPAPQE